MNARKLSAVAIVAVLGGALVCAGFASAGGAGHRAKTELTIQSWPHGLFGYVDSPKAKRCAKHREVVVFKQRGVNQNPAKDKRLGGAVAKRNQGGYQWSKKTGKTGKFYAKARKDGGCRVAFSKTEQSVTRGDIQSCPSADDVCRFDQMHVDINTYCPGFGYAGGDCSGDSTGGPSPWSPAFGYVVWDEDKPGTRHRSFDYHATNGEDKNPRAEALRLHAGPRVRGVQRRQGASPSVIAPERDVVHA